MKGPNFKLGNRKEYIPSVLFGGGVFLWEVRGFRASLKTSAFTKKKKS